MNGSISGIVRDQTSAVIPGASVTVVNTTQGIENKAFQIDDQRALEFRMEAFNAFNHAQFFGPVAVNGDINSNLFGQVVKAAPPRLVQLALKFTF